MDMNEVLKVTGRLTVVRTNAAGEVVETREIPNLVVTTGKQYIAQRLGQSTPPTIMSHMAIGSDSTTAVVGQSALLAELGRAVLTGTTVSGASVTYTSTFAPGVGTGNVYEAGIFNASSAGTMLCRTTFPLVTKQAGDTIAITWVVTVS